MKKKRLTKPLNYFKWSIQDENNYQRLFRETTTKWYESKHRLATSDEIKLINDLPIVDCPYCNKAKYIKYGKNYNGITKYKCKECNKIFTPLTGTLFDSKKIPISEWIEFIIHLFEFHSLKTSSSDNRNAQTTGKYWLNKVFLALKNYQDNIMLSGNIYLDETFFSVIKKDIQYKGKVKYKGLSRNKLCVGCATDNLHHIFIFEGYSKPNKESTLKTFKNHIMPNSTIIHDLESSHSILFDFIPNLRSKEYKSIISKFVEDKKNPLYPINHMQMLLKKFMSAHSGFNRDNIQDWLNLFAFLMNPPFDRNEKIIELLKLMINTRITLRFKKNKSKKS